MTDPPLLLLAVDHRVSLERDLYRLNGPPTPLQAARICADKLLVYQSLLDASAELPDGAQPGILIDEQYGASVAELAARTDGCIRLAMPIEASGEPWFHFAYAERWQQHAEFFGADYAKVLVRDNPGMAATERSSQAARLSEVSSWAMGGGHRLIIELLVPATASDLERVHGDRGQYDREVRPELTCSVMEYLQEHGVEPDIWKVEGLDAPQDAREVVATARRSGRHANCIVLGRHADRDDVSRWLTVAASVPGFVGFAIGRSIWWDALAPGMRTSEAEVREIIRSAYIDFVRLYLDARGAS